MSNLVRRGRVFFLILATAIVVDRSWCIVIALVGGAENLNFWRSVLLPALMIYHVVLLWQGENWVRWVTAVWSLLQGGIYLLIVGTSMYRLAVITPSEHAGVFLKFSAVFFGVLLLHAIPYVFAGLALLLSPSLKAFFAHQQKAAQNPWMALVHGILGFAGMGRSEEDERKKFVALIDAINAGNAGGAPTTIERHLGNLNVRSGVLVLGDPQYVPAVVLPNIDVDQVSISAKLWQYPSGGVGVIGLRINIGNDPQCEAPRKIGELGIDSAALVVADKADIDDHWTETGTDRIGVISTAADDSLLRELTRRFKLKTVQDNPVSAEVVSPVSEALEREIEDYLKSVPKYAAYPFLYFHVQTNNSFDRAIHLDTPWDFMPVGNDDLPLMFVCRTGRGDGIYDVYCQYAGDAPQMVSIDFIDDED